MSAQGPPDTEPSTEAGDDRPAGSEGIPDAGHAGHAHDAGCCDDVLAQLYTFVDGELTVERRARIKAHLDDCLPCFEAFDFEAELRIVVSQRCRESVPEELRARIARALDDETAERAGPP